MVEFLALESISQVEQCPVRQVGYSLGFTKSGAKRVVGKLATKGYVTKKMALNEARVCCLEVTAAGFAILEEAFQLYEVMLQDLFEELDPQEAEGIKQSLMTFARMFGQRRRGNVLGAMVCALPLFAPARPYR